jgi:hypothetical protein
MTPIDPAEALLAALGVRPIVSHFIERITLSQWQKAENIGRDCDALAKQMVASDYEIIDATEIIGLLSNSRCRTICVLDMCPYANTPDPLMWGTDIIGNVNIISFAESDAVSSGKLALIQVITNHLSA